jgi:hypothetical protein
MDNKYCYTNVNNLRIEDCTLGFYSVEKYTFLYIPAEFIPSMGEKFMYRFLNLLTVIAILYYILLQFYKNGK